MTAISSIKTQIANILLPIGVFFILYLGFKYWGDLKNHFLNVSLILFVLSVLFGIIGNLGFAFMFHALLSKYGLETNKIKSLSLFYISQITKYIPGKVWSYFFQISRINAPNSTLIIVGSNLELMALSIIINLTIGVMLYLSNQAYLYALCILISGFLISFIFKKISVLSFLPEKIKVFIGIAEALPSRKKLSSMTFLQCWLFSIVYTVSHLILFQAFFDISTDDAIQLTAFLLISWVVSLFAIVMPAGIGVKEAVFIFLAANEDNYDTSFLASVAIISRFWQITVDLSGAIFIMILSRFTKR